MKRFTIFTVSLIEAFALQLNAQIILDLKVFLEGPFNGTTMKTDLNVQNLIPLTQPFSVAPWIYNGTELVSSIPNPDIVDWVLVELRETIGEASTATPDKMINRQAAFIKADGSVVGTDGSSMIGYYGVITDNLYVLIWHRNHLAIMSSSPLIETGGLYSWDFTDQLTKAYLGGQKDMGGGKFGMFGGDCSADGWINILYKNDNWTDNACNAGYYSCDVNMDTQVNNLDKDEIWLSNKNQKVKLPEGLTYNCGDILVDERDDQLYSNIQIGSQCWMAENLNVGTMIPGLDAMYNNGVIEKYCYNNDPQNCNIYGGLYQWNEMMHYSTQQGIQGICPAGSHLPTDDEGSVLGDFLGGATIAGSKMKSTGTIEAGTGLWHAPNSGATNASGFTGIPGGLRNMAGIFGNLGNNALFWSSTSTGEAAWSRTLSYNVPSMGRAGNYKVYGFSVRCLKNE
jgi:uncharacterized protein (TIGR02145 family)